MNTQCMTIENVRLMSYCVEQAIKFIWEIEARPYEEAGTPKSTERPIPKDETRLFISE